ncbi:MAG: system Cascade subunit CasE [Euryarchaeota archaeon]|nr:system Cascade subunit CasE [Euryarchaeota archaeon]
MKPEAAANKEFWKLAMDLGDNYRIHRAIWLLFAKDPDKKRDFLYRQDEKGGFPSFYIVSEHAPEKNSDLWSIESKKYTPSLFPGQKLVFSLRANPIVTRWDDNGKHQRHDVVMDAKTRMEKEGIPENRRPQVTDIVQKEGVEWLKKKGEINGFEVSEGQVIATGYCCNRFFKPKGKHSVNISTIDFSGILTVTNTEAFTDALYRGIGPAKSFGCGLMLVRPAR